MRMIEFKEPHNLVIQDMNGEQMDAEEVTTIEYDQDNIVLYDANHNFKCLVRKVSWIGIKQG